MSSLLPSRVRFLHWLSYPVLVLAGFGCGPNPSTTSQCTSNLECATPLVCSLGRCREECRLSRDCTPGLECVRVDLDEDGTGDYGVCQVLDETDCQLHSDCPAPLQCIYQRCRNGCEMDSDCPRGSFCVTDEATGGRGCRVDLGECQVNSDCTEGGVLNLVCAADLYCRPQCRVDWDCPGGQECREDQTCAEPPPPDIPLPQLPAMAAGRYNTCAINASGELVCWGANMSGQMGDGTTGAPRSPAVVPGISGATMVGVGGIAIENVQGHAHVCAVTGSGLFCWGNNARGQVGTGVVQATYTSPQAISFPGVTDGSFVAHLSLGAEHSCAIITTPDPANRLFCWGANDNGQLGVGDRNDRNVPTEVLPPDGPFSAPPIEVRTLTGHTCVRLRDGRVNCFGLNGSGQLATQDSEDRLSPVLVRGLLSLGIYSAGLAVGTSHSCVFGIDEGRVACWGSNRLGQLGQASDGGLPALQPILTNPIPEPVLGLAAGSVHTCGRTASGVYCWGDNGYGQVGAPDGVLALAPRAVAELGTVDFIAAGNFHTCVRAGSTHQCFGNNDYAQLGDGNSGPLLKSHTPIAVVMP